MSRSQLLLVATLLTLTAALGIANDELAESIRMDIPNDPLVIDQTNPSMAPILALSDDFQVIDDGRLVVEREKLLSTLKERITALSDPPAELSIATAALKDRLTDIRLVHADNLSNRTEIVRLLENQDLNRLSVTFGQEVLQQVRDPNTSNRDLLKSIERQFNRCRESYKKKAEIDRCLQDYQVPELQWVVNDVSQFSGDHSCAVAARDLKADLALGCPSGCVDTGAKLDDECLHSLAGWKRKDGASKADPLPSILQSTNSSALSVIALIDRVDGVMRSHVCGGLLRPGNRVVTSRHCFNRVEERDALKQGRIYIRILNDRHGLGYPVASHDLSEDMAELSPATDGLILSFDAPSVLPVTKTEFRNVTTPERAVIIGRYLLFNRERTLLAPTLLDGMVLPTWYQSLRWTMPGLCHVMGTQSGCTHFQCQTLPGFSGTPIFAERSSEQESLVVVGIVSGPTYPGAPCGPHDSDTTLALAGTSIPILEQEHRQ